MFFNLFSRIKTKKYDHIISLGYNCEVAYRFYKHYHFLDSALFNWCNTIDIHNLIYAIKNFDKLITGDIVIAKPLWRCVNTNICFHGRAPMNLWRNDDIDEDIFKQDKEELISRITYLKQKFIAVGNDNKKNLYIIKYQTANDPQEVIIENINEVYYSLKNICKNVFDLLVIVEQKEKLMNLESYINNPNIYIRFVSFFASDTDVTGKKFDKKGWRKIFQEFKPGFKLKNQKKYKFDTVYKKIGLIIYLYT